ncbi:MAG: phosphomannose isomerase type II C-terminal cupin domain [Candidatus Methylomirabilales bacterium]
MVGEERPWGRWRILEEGPGYKVKRLEVEPGKRLSLQYHRHRSEYWVVVQGQATVGVGGRTLVLSHGESAHVPRTAMHRIENRGPARLIVIEVQTGAYLEEDDIVRLDDDYGRTVSARAAVHAVASQVPGSDFPP